MANLVLLLVAGHETTVNLIGNSVIALLRNPQQFVTPEKLDITRQNNKYLSFGAGIHHCLGSSLAKAEGRIALGVLLTRLLNLKLKEVELEYRRPFALRGVKAIPVTF